MIINTALIVVHLCFILNGLYQIGFGFDLYPALGLLTYAFLSLGMSLSLLLLFYKDHKHTTILLISTLSISGFLYSDLFFPGILLATWNVICVGIITVICYVLLISQGKRKSIVDHFSWYSIIATWLLLSFLLLSQLANSILYLTMGLSLAITSVLTIIRSITQDSK